MTSPGNPYDPARDSTFGDAPYAPPGARIDGTVGPQALPHGGLGVASFIVGLLAGFTALAVIVWAGYVGTQQPDLSEDSPVAMMIGLGILLSGAALFLGVVLGVAGLFQGGRRKLFAILGLVLNSLGLLFALFVIAVGIAAGA